MIINNMEVEGDYFAFDGCHKIYILEDQKDYREARESDYKVYPIKDLISCYINSCPLRFIHNWKLDKSYVRQCEDITITFKSEELDQWTKK